MNGTNKIHIMVKYSRWRLPEISNFNEYNSRHIENIFPKLELWVETQINNYVLLSQLNIDYIFMMAAVRIPILFKYIFHIFLVVLPLNGILNRNNCTLQVRIQLLIREDPTCAAMQENQNYWIISVRLWYQNSGQFSSKIYYWLNG